MSLKMSVMDRLLMILTLLTESIPQNSDVAFETRNFTQPFHCLRRVRRICKHWPIKEIELTARVSMSVVVMLPNDMRKMQMA